MNNLYEYNLKTNYKKLVCDGLLFVEYQCMPGDVRSGIWSQHSYIAFIQSGRKTWITPDGEFPVSVGDAIFCKKGAHHIQNYYDEQFCALIFFIPDNFIREVVLEAALTTSERPANTSVLKMDVDAGLKMYFESMIGYFLRERNPSTLLLKLKFRELILQIITGHLNRDLAAYFHQLTKEDQSDFRQVMLDNYLFPLSQDEYAKLTHRSLSTFKREFQQVFGTAPGKWLLEMRMKYTRMLLLTTEESINDIASRSGIETTSHFIRCFKQYYGLPPHQFRQRHAALIH